MPRMVEVCLAVVCPEDTVKDFVVSRFFHLAVLFLLLSTFHESFVNRVVAQSATATLSGVVTDQAGDLVTGANIDLISITQGFTRSTTTNSQAIFIFALVPPGSYTLRVEHQGFHTFERNDVVLNVNDQRVINISLNVGDLKSATVDVVDGTPLLEEATAVGTTVDRQFVGNIPLNGRSIQPLINLSPGTVLTRTSSSEAGQFSVNGQRANANYFTIDGVSANIGVSVGQLPTQAATGSLPGFSASGGTNNLVSIDALQEFKIQTSSYAAEFGRTPGAQVQIITRAGTNRFHGSAFDYLRNEVFEANDWFNNARRLPQPATRQNNFGFVLGGPILLPRFGEGGRQPGFNGKNSSFFFFSYEGLRLRLPQSKSVDVPSLAARQAAPANIQPILSAYPLPNGPNRLGTNGQPNGWAIYNASFSNPSNLDATSIRIDHAAGSRATLFGRYNYSPSSVIERAQAASFSVNGLAHYAVKTHTLTGGATILFTPNVNGEVRLNYSKNTALNFFDADNLGGAVLPPDSLLFPAGTSPARDVVLVSFTGFPGTSLQLGTAAENLQRQFNAVGNLSVIGNAHQLKFGIDYRRLTPVVQPQHYSLTLRFAGIGTPGAATQPTGAALTGNIQGATIATQLQSRFPLFTNVSLYGQDTWKATRRLTLNYGLRWEFNVPPGETSGHPPATVTGLGNPATATIAPPGTPLWNASYNNFAPRFGVAYQLVQTPGRETMLRGGGGIFYDLGYGSIMNAFWRAYPYVSQRAVPSVPFPLSATNAASATTPTTDFFYVFDPNINLPRTYQWNFAIEQSLGVNQTITTSYVAALGRKLLREDTVWGTQFGGTLNPAVFIPTTQVIVSRNTATSDYHAFQAQFQRRLSKGFQALASYTWAHSIDIASNDSFNVNTPSNRLDPRTDRGPSDFDIRHAFNAAATYDIPELLKNGVGSAIFRNWSVDGIFTARSATPVNVFHSVVIPSLGVVATVRPDLVEGIPIYIDDPTAPGGRRLNNTRVIIPGNPNPQLGPFFRPVVPRQGSLGRNALRGFPVHQMDFAMRRQFHFGERMNLQFKTEFFNVFNHPNFGDPDGLLQSSNFGFSTTMFGRSLGAGGSLGGFNPLYQVGGPRSIQFSLKLGF